MGDAIEVDTPDATSIIAHPAVDAWRELLDTLLRNLRSPHSRRAYATSLRAFFAPRVVAVVAGQTVGCAFLTGDNAGFYYVRDVIVHPDWQGRRIGTALMQALMEHLRAHGPAHALVGLFTGSHLHDFYAQFGFRGPNSGLYGMTQTLGEK